MRLHYTLIDMLAMIDGIQILNKYKTVHRQIIIVSNKGYSKKNYRDLKANPDTKEKAVFHTCI